MVCTSPVKSGSLRLHVKPDKQVKGMESRGYLLEFQFTEGQDPTRHTKCNRGRPKSQAETAAVHTRDTVS